MTDAILLRRRVRAVLSALPRKRRASEELIFDKLQPDFPDLKADQLHAALLWNLTHGFADSLRNDDEEREEWCLTPEGWHKEGLA